VSLCSQLIDDLAAARYLELAARHPLPGPPPAPPRRPAPGELTPTQAHLSANREEITPDRPGHERWCDYCGSTRADLVPGDDGPEGAWVCRDERQCLARKEFRYPPDPSRVPPAFLAAARAHDEAQAARQEPARQEPARQQEPAGEEPAEPAQSGAEVPVSQDSSFTGWYDHLGQWHAPGLPQFDAFAHTLMHPHNRTHLLSGQVRPHYYGGPHYVPPGVLSGQQDGAQEEPQQEPQQAGKEIPPAQREPQQAGDRVRRDAAGLPLPGSDVRGHVDGGGAPGSGDIAMIPHPLPAARPQQRPPRDRYGRRRTRWR
jgi:hypothetical protein